MSQKSLNDLIESLIDEVEKELEEITTTGDVAGYNTPNAFSDGSSKNKKRKKKIATQLGMKLAGKIDEGILQDREKQLKNLKQGGVVNGGGYGPFKKTGRDTFVSPKGKKYNSSALIKFIGTFGDFKIDEANEINEWKLQLDLGKVNPSEFEKWADSSLQKKHKIKVSGSGKNWTITGKGNDDRMGSSANWITQLLGKSWKGGNMRVVHKESINEAQVVNKKTGKDITKHVLDLLSGKINQKQFEKLTGLKKESVNENRWLELKNDDTMHPHKKMAMGLKELKYQLAETEKFFKWYNKIKTMNELDSQNYWKRTQNHIYKIKERLINIAKTLQEIEK